MGRNSFRSPYRWTPFERCFGLALSQAPMHFRGHVPVAARARHRGTALSASRRWLPRRPELLEKSVSVGCSGFRECPRLFREFLCERANEKPPDGNPRAFAFLGDRGDRSPRRKSVWKGVFAAAMTCEAALRSRFPAVPYARIRIAATARWHQRVGVAEDGVHEVRRQEKTQRTAEVAQITRAYFRLQTFFLRTDERSNPRPCGSNDAYSQRVDETVARIDDALQRKDCERDDHGSESRPSRAHRETGKESSCHRCETGAKPLRYGNEVSARQGAAFSAATAPARARRDRAVSVARRRSGAVGRPGTRCDPARPVRAGTAGRRSCAAARVR